MKRQWVVTTGLITAFVAFWILRALFGGPAPEHVEQSSIGPPQQDREEQAKPTLVEPPTFVGNTPPLRLLQNMYGHIEGLCWEHGEPGYDAASRRIPLGFTANDEPPIALVKFLESSGRSFKEYQYRWFGSYRLLLMRQEWMVTPGGREGPRAGMSEVFRFESSDGSTFWGYGDGAGVAPCDPPGR